MVIKINLLPPEILRQRKIKWTKIGIACVLIIAVSICSIRYILLKIIYEGIERDIKKEEELIEELRPKVAELHDLEKQIEEMAKRINLINQLQKGRFMWVKFMNALCYSVPDGVWINDLVPTYKEGGYDMAMSATAFDNFSIANFMVNLIQEESFKEVELIKITSSEIEGIPVKNFNLSWRFVPPEE